MQHSLAAHAWPEEVSVRVRIGLHTGQPLLSSEGYVGLDVPRAARIMSAGHGGQVLLSATTQELVKHDLPDGVSLRDLGEYRLKDLQHPSRLYHLVMAELPADFPPLKTLDAHPNNLPIQPSKLIGREREVVAIQRLLQRDDVRLVTLTGPGGIGKTRLALQMAAELSDHFPDGVYFVNLAPTSDPALVVPTIAHTLEVKEIPGQSLLDQLKASLREKHLLLLLDNFEQVVSAALQVADLLATCPKLKMVVTSRMTLRLQSEHEFAVPPLALPDPSHLPDPRALSQYEAVALFIERAQAVKPEFQVTNATAPVIAEICVRMDGLPLAIELAAARVKVLPPQALLARLGQRLHLLTSGARDMPARQQTLRNTLVWSYDLLTPVEQRLFWRLSIFVGGCTLEALESVCAALDDGAGQVLDGVSSLLDKSLLQQSEQEEGELALRLCAALWWFWNIRGYWSEGLRWLEAALGLPQARGRTEWRAKALSGAGVLAFRLSTPADRSWFEESVAIFRELADKRGLAEALEGLSQSMFIQNDDRAGHRLLEESLSLAREAGIPGCWPASYEGWPIT
jgi:predicted ATPase